MNVAFFLTPKSDVRWMASSTSVAEAVRMLASFGYTAVPVLDEAGCYWGTLSEGDLLRAVTLADPPWRGSLARVPLTELTLRGAYQTVRIDAQMEELLAMAAHQNFVPVVDDREVFVGIVRRQIIIEYFTQQFGVNLSDSDAASS